MTDNNISPVTADHAQAFGYIMHLFAKCEYHMQFAAAGILNSDIGTAVILMGDMHYRQKRQTLRHLNTSIGIDGKTDLTLMTILDDLDKHQRIRNHIAHSMWTAGREPGAIKPMQLILRADKPKPLGHHHNEENYTVSRLLGIARSLDSIDRRFTEYLETTGLRARVRAKIEETISSNGSSPG